MLGGDEGEAAAREAALRHFPNPESLSRYVDILLSRGIDWGLLGPREGARIWSRHVLNSIPHAGLPAAAARVVDIGSGAGLPGIPLALLRPDLVVVLLEPMQRRSDFLGLAVEELGLAGRVSVVRGRVEDLADPVDVLTARAVAPVERLARWSRPLLQQGAELLALKGASVAAELASAAPVLRRQGLVGEARSVSYADDLPAGWIARVVADPGARRTGPSVTLG